MRSSLYSIKFSMEVVVCMEALCERHLGVWELKHRVKTFLPHTNQDQEKSPSILGVTHHIPR